MIVAIHTGFIDQYIYPTVRLAVPLFFIFSGFFAFSKIDSAKNLSAQKSILKNTISRYLKLYLFWFIVSLPLMIYFRYFFKEGFLKGIFIFIRQFFLGSTFSASWFLMACMLGIIIVFHMSRHFSNKTLILLSIPFYLFATLLSEFKGYIISVPKLTLPTNNMRCFSENLALHFLFLCCIFLSEKQFSILYHI